MARYKLTISDVNKKHLKIIAYLLGSWGLAYLLSLCLKDPRYVGLAPALNYVAWVIETELKNEGYRKALLK
jgi:hypothetical protein